MTVSLAKVLTGWQCVIYLDGSEYNAAEETADAVVARAIGEEKYIGLYRGTVEWCDALFDHLAQWDYGDSHDCEHNNPREVWYSSAPMHEIYLLCWDTLHGMAALYVKATCECE